MTQPAGATHEALLNAAMSSMPDFLETALQTAEPLNASMHDHRAELKKQAEAMIASGDLPGYLYEMLRADAAAQFAAPTFDEPEVRCGVALTKEIESLDGSSRFELVNVVDLLITISIPYWDSIGFRSIADLQTPKVRPSTLGDTLRADMRTRHVQVLFGIYDSSVTLGQALRSITELEHDARAGDQDSVRVVAVIEREELFDAMASNHDVILIQDGIITDHAIERLQALHSAPAYVDTPTG